MSDQIGHFAFAFACGASSFLRAVKLLDLSSRSALEFAIVFVDIVVEIAAWTKGTLRGPAIFLHRTRVCDVEKNSYFAPIFGVDF
jgi:hypothetical protein